MDSNKKKTILALVAVLIFIFSMIGAGMLGSGISLFGGEEENQEIGYAEFSGILRTYDPILVIPGGITLELMNELESLQGVEDVYEEQGNTVIELETRDDVYPTAIYLKNQKGEKDASSAIG